jgi:hypothetical protein
VKAGVGTRWTNRHHLLLPFWPLADAPKNAINAAIGGKADVAIGFDNCAYRMLSPRYALCLTDAGVRRIYEELRKNLNSFVYVEELKRAAIQTPAIISANPKI